VRAILLSFPFALTLEKSLFHCSFSRESVGFLGHWISPSQGRYLHRTTQTQNKRTSMPQFEFEPPIQVFMKISCMFYSLILKKCSSETSVDIQRNTALYHRRRNSSLSALVGITKPIYNLSFVTQNLLTVSRIVFLTTCSQRPSRKHRFQQ
jgi:hypothetical protein